MPTGDASYQLTLPEGVEAFVPNAANDPVILKIAEAFKAAGKPQSAMNDIFGLVKILADGGAIQPPFDPAAETAALGDGGAALQQEQQTFLTSLKDRGELSEGAFGELMTLVPTANGTRAIQELRKLMTTNNDGAQLPNGQALDAKAQAQKDARDLAADPRYKTDRNFKKAADEAYKAAFG